LLPSHIQRADAVDHDDYAAVFEQANEDVSRWPSSKSGRPTEDEFEENDMIATLESPYRPLAKHLSTPPLPASVPRTTSRSSLAKIPSISFRNKGKNGDFLIYPN
jgi:hypothetical protein